MAVLRASVEPNGWVLTVTILGPPCTFGDYIFRPDTVPTVRLSTTAPGYCQVENAISPALVNRFLVATRALRLPIDPGNPRLRRIDERLSRDGTVVVRLALNEFVYATDRVLRLSLAAGWRTGERACELVVENNSTVDAPAPVFRWADAPFQRQTDRIVLELVAFSHHPRELQGLAGVRFRVSDGVTSRGYWTTQLATSDTYDDALRCYRVELTGDEAKQFQSGILRCEADLFPWIGQSRSTDSGELVPNTMARRPGGTTAAQQPMVIAWDPDGTRYQPCFTYVDPDRGSTNPSTVSVSTDERAARSGVNAATITVAFQAVALAKRSLGGGGVSDQAALYALDAAHIRLRAGTHANLGNIAIDAAAGTTDTLGDYRRRPG